MAFVRLPSLEHVTRFIDPLFTAVYHPAYPLVDCKQFLHES